MLFRNMVQKGDEVLQECAKVSLQPAGNEKPLPKRPHNLTTSRSSSLQKSSQKSSVRKPPNQQTTRSSSQTPNRNLTKTSYSIHQPSDLPSDNIPEQTGDKKQRNSTEKPPDKTNSDTDSLEFSDPDVPPCPPCPPCQPNLPKPCSPDPKPSSSQKGPESPNKESKPLCKSFEKRINTEPIYKNKKCQVHCACKKRKDRKEKYPLIRKIYVRYIKRNGSGNRMPVARYHIKRRNQEDDVNLLTRIYNIFKQNIKNPQAFIEYLRSKGIIQIKRSKNMCRR